MTSNGVVREFHSDQGWGVIDGPDVPGGCWVHFAAIAMDGFRELTAGQAVSFRAEAATQDGFRYRAVKVWTGATEPDNTVPDSTSGAYWSELTQTRSRQNSTLARGSQVSSPGPRWPNSR